MSSHESDSKESSSNHNPCAGVVDDVIRRRRTWKVLASPEGSPLSSPTPSSDALLAHESLVRSAIETAGFAPFHYDRRQNGVSEPWRFYWLKLAACRTLSQQLPTLAENMKPGNKLPGMLAACGSLVIVTWLPEQSNVDEQKLQLVNEEHLAAASAATQNLLLALEARGLGTYWSSGGSLRDKPVRSQFGISDSERLIAAVFIDDRNLRPSGEVECIPGKNHEKRTEPSRWCRVVDSLAPANESR